MNPLNHLPPTRRRRFWGACLAIGTAIAGFAAAAPSTTVVISQVYGGGGNSGAPFNRDFVELHNISSQSQSIAGWSIQYTSAAGDSWGSNKLNLTGSIPAGGYFLIQLSGGTTGEPLPTPDATGAINMAAANGKVALVSSTTNLTGTNPTADPTVVDFVGFGTANAWEGSGAAPAPSNTTSITRDANSRDTDNNAADFVTLSPPAPRNSATTPFIPEGPGDTPPAVQALSPANNAVDVALGAALTVTFNEAIAAGTGSVTLRTMSGDALVQSFAVPSAAVEISGSSATIQPSSPLAEATGYYVEISAGAFQDLAGNSFPGFTGSGTWSFTTIGPDTIGPQVVSVSPANGAAGVDPESFLSAMFDEDAFPGTGSIVIRDVSNLSVITTLNVGDDSAVLVSGAFLSITPPAPLPINKTMRVEFPAGLFVDALGNPSPAFGQDGEWTFSTPLAASFTVGGYAQNFATFTSAETLPLGWSVTASGSAPNRLNYSAWHTAAAANTDTGIKFKAIDPEVNVFGYQHSGSTGVVGQTLSLVNDTGAAITALSVTYRGRVSRVAEGRNPFYTVTVAGVVAEGLTYSTVDGDDVFRGASVSGLSIAEGELFTIVWTSDGSNDGSPGSGSRKQLGISEVTVATGTSLFTPSVAGVAFDLGTLTATAVKASSSVTTDGGSALLGRGFVFAIQATNPSPVIGGAGVTQVSDASASVGAFSAELKSLAPGTVYSVRSYAVNSEGTTYSTAATITTLPTPPSLVTTYLQPFADFSGSTVAGTMPVGWKAVSSGGINGFAGTWAPATSSGGLLGNVNSPGVLGYQHVNGSGVVTVSLSLVNSSGGTLDELNVSYLGRVNRTNLTRSPEWEVSLNGTVVPELAYSTSAGTDQVKSAVISGLSIAPGEVFTLTWVSDGDAGGEGARRQIGIANVVVSTEEIVGGDDYASWAIANGIGGELPGDDFDRDGISNFMEYALGLNPTVPSGSPGTFEGGVVSFAKGADAVANGDVQYVIETSTTLAVNSWTPVTPTTNTATEISYLLPTGQGRIFARLVVTAAP